MTSKVPIVIPSIQIYFQQLLVSQTLEHVSMPDFKYYLQYLTRCSI
jgi:hypothetical protein